MPPPSIFCPRVRTARGQPELTIFRIMPSQNCEEPFLKLYRHGPGATSALDSIRLGGEGFTEAGSTGVASMAAVTVVTSSMAVGDGGGRP